MIKIIDLIENFLSSLAKNIPDVRLRIGIVLLIIISIVIFIWFIDNQTNLIVFWYLHKKIDILKELIALNADLASDELFKSIYHQLLEEIYSLKYFSIAEKLSKFIGACFNIIESLNFQKFLAGSSLGILIMCISAYQLIFTQRDDARTTFLGALMWGVCAGVISLFLPVIFKLWINYIIYLILQIFLLIIMGQSGQSTQKIEES